MSAGREDLLSPWSQNLQAMGCSICNRGSVGRQRLFTALRNRKQSEEGTRGGALPLKFCPTPQMILPVKVPPKLPQSLNRAECATPLTSCFLAETHSGVHTT